MSGLEHWSLVLKAWGSKHSCAQDLSKTSLFTQQVLRIQRFSELGMVEPMRKESGTSVAPSLVQVSHTHKCGKSWRGGKYTCAAFQ